MLTCNMLVTLVYIMSMCVKDDATARERFWVVCEPLTKDGCNGGHLFGFSIAKASIVCIMFLSAIWYCVVGCK